MSTLKDKLIDLIPVKKLRREIKFKYGSFPYCGVVKNVKISHSKNLKLGKYVFIGGGCHLLCEGGLEIGSYTRLGHEVMILTSNHNYKSDKLLPFDEVDFKQKVVIGQNCWIASRAVICPGVKLEEGSIVATGAIVTKSVPKCAIVGGNPAKIIGFRDIELYDKLKKEGKSATFEDVKNRKWVEIEGFKDYLK